MRTLARRLGPVAVAVVAAACSSGAPSTTARSTTSRPPATVPAGPHRFQGGVRIERTLVGPRVHIEGVAASGSDVVVLASSKGDRSGDRALWSTDAGRTWRSADTTLRTGSPVGEVDSTVAPPEPALFAAGGSFFAITTRARSAHPLGYPREVQAVAASVDHGASWHRLAFPAPPGSTALVDQVVGFDRTIVAVGAIQQDRSGPSPWTDKGFDEQDHLGYDAGVWTSEDGGRTFARVPGAPFAGVPGLQALNQVVRFGRRLVAIGSESNGAAQATCCNLVTRAVSFSSSDGRHWTPLTGLEADPDVTAYARPHIEGDDLVAGSFDVPARLGRDATRWDVAARPAHPADAPVQIPPDAAYLQPMVSGDGVITWMLDTACDCSVAYTTRLVRNRPVSTPLAFDGCGGRSVESTSWVDPPHRLGPAIAALAWCNDRGGLAAAVATSRDGGATWSTQRLGAFAPPGTADLDVAGHDFLGPAPYLVPSGGALVVALQAGPASVDGSVAEPLAPLVILRVTAAG